MVVTFCGHNYIPDTDDFKLRLRSSVERLITEGADLFLFGGYGGFDLLAANTVFSLKNEAYPAIRSTLVVPYLSRQYDTEPYDDTVFPPLENVPLRYAISRRNKWMVDQADAVVAYVTHSWGGAAITYEYAQRRKKRIIMIEP